MLADKVKAQDFPDFIQRIWAPTYLWMIYKPYCWCINGDKTFPLKQTWAGGDHIVWKQILTKFVHFQTERRLDAKLWIFMRELQLKNSYIAGFSYVICSNQSGEEERKLCTTWKCCPESLLLCHKGDIVEKRRWSKGSKGSKGLPTRSG